MRTEYCRACARPVVWALSVNGMVPLDVEPSAGGTFLVETVQGVRRVRHLGQRDLALLNSNNRPDLRTAHRATCPRHQ